MFCLKKYYMQDLMCYLFFHFHKSLNLINIAHALQNGQAAKEEFGRGKALTMIQMMYLFNLLIISPYIEFDIHHT